MLIAAILLFLFILTIVMNICVHELTIDEELA